MSASSTDTHNILHYVVKNNIIQSIVTTVIAFRLLELVTDIMDCLVLPLVGMDVNTEEAKKTTKGIKAQIMLVSLFKFLIIVYIVFLLSRLTRKAFDGT